MFEFIITCLSDHPFTANNNDQSFPFHFEFTNFSIVEQCSTWRKMEKQQSKTKKKRFWTRLLNSWWMEENRAIIFASLYVIQFNVMECWWNCGSISFMSNIIGEKKRQKNRKKKRICTDLHLRDEHWSKRVNESGWKSDETTALILCGQSLILKRTLCLKSPSLRLGKFFPSLHSLSLSARCPQDKS